MEERILPRFLGECKKYCEQGGYTKLSESFPDIRQLLLEEFPENGFGNYLDSLIAGTEKHVSVLHNCGGRVFDWSNIQPLVLEKKLNEINISPR